MKGFMLSQRIIPRMTDTYQEQIIEMLDKIKGNGRITPTVTEWTDNGIIITRPLQTEESTAAAATTTTGPIITELGSKNCKSKGGSTTGNNNNNPLQTIVNFMNHKAV